MINVERMVSNLCEMVKIPSESSEEQEFIQHLAEKLTSNVGVIEGGLIRNGVPDHVFIKAEVHRLNHEKCLALSQTMKEVFETAAKAMGARAEVNLNLAYHSMRIPEDSPMVAITKEALGNAGIKLRVLVITGGLEPALYNTKGILTIPIGNSVRDEHPTHENISIEDMSTAVGIFQYPFNRFCIA